MFIKQRLERKEREREKRLPSPGDQTIFIAQEHNQSREHNGGKIPKGNQD